MYKYGQYCPIAKAVEILGDRWTLLIVRDMLTGSAHFNDLERGLPGISRGLLAERLRRLHKMGIVEKRETENGRRRTAYHLTPAGVALQPIIESLLIWGVQHAFGEPDIKDLDPLLLLWWMKESVLTDKLPSGRVVAQFDFTGAVRETYWLMLSKEDTTVCQTDPGFGLDILITADIATFFKIWLGKTEFSQALAERTVAIDAIPTLAQAFPNWFVYSLAAPAVRMYANP